MNATAGATWWHFSIMYKMCEIYERGDVEEKSKKHKRTDEWDIQSNRQTDIEKCI